MNPALSRLRALLDLMKAEQGPFIGPRGGKWADAEHTIPWRPHHAHGYNAAARGSGTVGVSNHQVRVLVRHLAERWERWKAGGKRIENSAKVRAVVHTPNGIRRISVILLEASRGGGNEGVADGFLSAPTARSLHPWLQRRDVFFAERGLQPVPWPEYGSPDKWYLDPARAAAHAEYEKLYPHAQHLFVRYEPERVFLYINKFSDLQNPKTQQRLRSVLAHELTHIIDYWPAASKETLNRPNSAQPGTYAWWEEYINRPAEVRAWTREVYRDMNTPAVAESVRTLPALSSKDVFALLNTYSPYNFGQLRDHLSDHNWRRLLSKMSRLLLQHRDGTSVPLEKAGYYLGER